MPREEALVTQGSKSTLPRFCSQCGSALTLTVNARAAPTCIACGTVHYDTPRSLVLCAVFAGNRLLLMRRATPPYVGRWAPPGGFAEAGETLQNATVREVFEETGVRLDPADLVPLAITSVAHMNQVYIMFRAHIDECAVRPGDEALDARWFDEDALPFDNFWLPDWIPGVRAIYASVRSGTFKLYLGEATESGVTSRSFGLTDRPRR
jgi:ADP-ribose pyrophosphatase YjhB (NUDIX family)